MADDGFSRIVSALDPALIVVTAEAGSERAGCLVGFHSQSSIDPKRYCVWLSKANHTFRVGVHARSFAVHFPSEDDEPLARLIGTTSGDDTDKFASCDWEEGHGACRRSSGCEVADLVS